MVDWGGGVVVTGFMALPGYYGLSLLYAYLNSEALSVYVVAM